MEKLDIYKLMTSPSGFLPYFKGGLESWKGWLVFFKVMAGRTDLDAAEMEIFTAATGLRNLPTERQREVYLCCGRRSGKSTICAVMAVAYALWGGWQEKLQGGEDPMIFIVSPTMEQGKVILGYVKSILSLPHFKKFVKRERQGSVELKNGTQIIIKPASWRSSRGWGAGLIILEEMAFFRFESESALVDIEIYEALKPSTANIENSLFAGVSTPYLRAGLLFQKSANWGKPGRILFWRAPTWIMNTSLTEAGLREEYSTLSEAAFNSEFGASEREDIEAWLPVALIDGAMDPAGASVRDASYQKGTTYYIFADPSEGLHKGDDSMTIGVSHGVEDSVVVDFLQEFKPPFKPKHVISQVVEICSRYRVSTITEDSHAIGWISDQLEPHGISVEKSKLNKSQIYAKFAVLAGDELVSLPADQRLREQLMGLQRFNQEGGLLKIDHLPRSKDDLANSACGCALLAVIAAGSPGYIGSPKHDVVHGGGDDRESFPYWGRG
jgi:hypothetical protein